MNGNLFSRVLETLEQLRPGSTEVMQGQRYIVLTQDILQLDSEREYLSSLKVDRFSEDTSLRWARVETQHGVKLIFSGPDLDVSEGLNVRASTPSEFLFFTDFFKLYPKRDQFSLLEMLSFGSRSEASYLGHPGELVSGVFEPVYVMDGPELQNNCTSNIISQHLISIDRSQKASFNFSIAERVRTSPWISCRFEEARILALLNYSNPLSFLSIYWLVEQLYFEAAAKDLFDEIRPAVDEQSFYHSLENRLDWRPKELAALSKLVQNSISEAGLDGIEKVLGIKNNDTLITREKRSEVISRNIYSFRNSLVYARHRAEKPSQLLISCYTCTIFDVAHETLRFRHPNGQQICDCGVSFES